MIKQHRRSASRVIFSESEEETIHAAYQLAQDFIGQETVLLVGPLGAGKTVFAKGLAAGLGVADIHQVCSPSYTLVNIYQGRVPVYHIDLYRLEREDEVLDLGWEDYLGTGVVIVEWAEKLNLEIDAFRVDIDILDVNRRRIEISCPQQP